MRLLTFATNDGRPRPGVVAGTTVYDLSSQGFSDLLEVVASGQLPEAKGEAFEMERVQLLAPISNPPRVFGIGLNYRDHALEAGMQIPTTPVVFFKLASSIVGPDAPVVLPRNAHQVDYEAELAVVIGRGGYRIAAADAMQHVFGYTILNDVSARDIQLATSQWSMGKSFPTFCPMGPVLVTADEIPDPHRLDISLVIDSELLQHSNTRELIFPIPDLIEYLSSITPLMPGDVISTGTPPGVGMGRKPQRWLQPNETMTVEIARIGALSNPVIAE